jgi:hypothetical protein
MVHDLRTVLRLASGRALEPTAAILDSRTLRSSPESGHRAGYDGAKRKRGSKVHAAVDTLGHLFALHVTPADEQDRARVNELAEAVQEATGESVVAQGPRSGAIRPSRTIRGSGSRSDPFLATSPAAARVTRDPGADRKSPPLRFVKYVEGRRQRRGGKRGSCDARRRTGAAVADRSGEIPRVRVGQEGRSRRSRSAPRAQPWAAPRPPPTRSLPHPEPARSISGSPRSSHPSRWSLTIPAACISA